MRKILTLITLLLTFSVVHADDINRQQAKQIAEDFFANRGIQMLDGGTSGMKKSAVRDNATAPYHVFNAGNDNGFVIVSGSDVTEQILGYTDSGTFDEENLPENIKSWLQFYSDQIQWVEENKADIQKASKAKRKVAQTRHYIAPLLPCKWNQGNPYNLLCPEYYNEDGTRGLSATGCVATAYAQLLYFYKYPAATTKTIARHILEYDVLVEGEETEQTMTVTMPAVEAGAKIDWENMCDTYSGDETDEQKKAVANLMVLVGQAFKMGYGPSSGAVTSRGPEILRDYFGYDDSIYYLSSNDCGIQEWFDIIYNRLAEGHPVLFRGSSTGGGHAFVVDGFDGEGLFHVNWGWGGGSDGFFRLTVLNPGDNSGLGASSSPDGYNMGQGAILGVKPGDDGVAKVDYNIKVASPSARGTTIRASFRKTSETPNDFESAIVMRNKSGELEVVSDIQDMSELTSGVTKSYAFDMTGKFTKPGTYKLTPATRIIGTTNWKPFWNLVNDHILATVAEDLSFTLKKHTSVEDIEVTNWEFKGSLTKDSRQEVVVTFKNNGDEFDKDLGLYASMTDDKGKATTNSYVPLKAGETSSISFYFTPDSVGTWNLWIMKDDVVYGSTTVNIIDPANVKKTTLRLNSISIDNNAYGNCLVGELSILNKSNSTYTGAVTIQLWRDGEDGWWYGSGSRRMELKELASGQTQSATFSFDNLQIGTTYSIAVGYTTQDGRLENGGIGTNKWKLQDGVLRWTKDGTIAGSAVTSAMRFQATQVGASFYGSAPDEITLSKNTNTIFVFENGMTLPAGIEGANIVIDGQAENINLVSDYSCFFPVDVTAQNATFSHTFTVAGDGIKGWEAITLPFKPESVTVDGEPVTWQTETQEGKFLLREFGYQDDNGTVVFTDVEGVESLRGNNPYVISATEELVGKTIVFHGSYVKFSNTKTTKMSVSTDEYMFTGITLEPRMLNVYMLNETGDAYEYVTRKTAIDPFANYFTTTLSEELRAEKIVIASPEVTGIKDINVSKPTKDNRIYDLQGRLVENPGKGIYIKNGRKIIK